MKHPRWWKHAGNWNLSHSIGGIWSGICFPEKKVSSYWEIGSRSGLVFARKNDGTAVGNKEISLYRKFFLKPKVEKILEKTLKCSWIGITRRSLSHTWKGLKIMGKGRKKIDSKGSQRLLQQMILIRRFEEKSAGRESIPEVKIRGFLSSLLRRGERKQ